jgi:hypothetical protein
MMNFCSKLNPMIGFVVNTQTEEQERSTLIDLWQNQTYIWHIFDLSIDNRITTRSRLPIGVHTTHFAI